MVRILLTTIVWCIRNPLKELGLMFIPVRVKAAYFPWALMMLHILMGGGIFDDLIGIVCGHLYHYLDFIYPNNGGKRYIHTPSFLYKLFQQDTIQTQFFDGSGRRLGRSN
jgi:Derlin-2/3